MHEDQSVVREPQVTVDDIAITELNTGFRYNASAESPLSAEAFFIELSIGWDFRL